MDGSRAHECDLALVGGRVVDPETGLDAVVNVAITNGLISAVTSDELRGTRVAFALAAFFVVFVMWLAGKPVSMPFWGMTAVFALVSAIAWVHLDRLDRLHPELRGRSHRLRDV